MPSYGSPYYGQLFGNARPFRTKTQRDYLRDLDEARIAVRWSRVLFAGAVAFTVATVGGWIALVNWGLQGYGQQGVDKGGAVFGLGVLLLLLTGAALAASGFSGIHLSDCGQDLRKAQYAYEDAILEDAS